MSSPMVRLKAHFNNYAWGKLGHKSEVANLFAAGHDGFVVDDKMPYSELWMGTHPDGPALIRDEGLKLSEFIAKSNSTGDLERNNNTISRNEIHLSYIMKVMSIRWTLSLQVHPTKEQAARLHKEDPGNYPDRNHKPELAYALSRFELLCGFRPAEEILFNIEAFECLRELLGEENCRQLRIACFSSHPQKKKNALQHCFQYMMNQERMTVMPLINELLTELNKNVRGALLEETVEVVRKMALDFPGDVGVFSPLLLNHMILQPGECVYYAAQELHAYLSGECVECVGCSNNTIRAAMTPKFKDTKNLVKVLNYEMTKPSDYLVDAKPLDGYPCVDEYAPDCKDFQLHRISVPRGGSGLVPSLDCGSIMVIYMGRAWVEEYSDHSHTSYRSQSSSHLLSRAEELKRGDIVYIRPGRRLRISHCSEDMQAFRTFSFEEGPDHENRNCVGRRQLNGMLCMEDEMDVISQSNNDEENGALRNSTESGIFEVECEMDGFI